MNVSNYDIIIIIIYFVFLFTIGFFRRSKNHISQTDYIVYGRKLSLPGFVITLVSTWYGAILGVGENTYLYGIQTWFIFAFPYYIFAIVYALWLSKIIWKKNVKKFINIGYWRNRVFRQCFHSNDIGKI